MNKLSKASSPRVYGLAAMTAALAVGSAVLLAGAVGAGSNPSTAQGVSAVPTTAITSGAKVVNLRSLPTVSRGSIGGPSVDLPFHSPLGKMGLAAAKKNADTNAPVVEGQALQRPTARGAVGPKTPGDANEGFDGMANSGTICPYFGGTGGNGCTPSDQGIASNGTDVVQLVNMSLEVYDTTGGVVDGPTELTTFFGVPSVDGCGIGNDPTDPFVNDPRVLWDPADGRWYVAALEVEGVFGIGDCDPVSQYWIAVSQTDDPAGLWNVYHVDTATPGVFDIPGYADYTLLGFNGDGLYIGGNLYDADGLFYLGAFVLGMDKKAMQDGDPITAKGFKLFTANRQLLDTVHPVASYGAGDGGPSGEFLIGSFNSAKTGKAVVVWDFSNVTGDEFAGTCDSSHQCITGVVVGTHKYSQPPAADNGDLCHDCLETIDNRISATPVYMHGNIYFTHDTAVKARGGLVNANVHWGIVHPATTQPVVGCGQCSLLTTKTSLVDDGYLTYAGETDTWFGAIQPDREGNLFLGFDYQSQTFDSDGDPGFTYPSSAYIARRATAAVGSGWPDGGKLLQAGTGNIGSDPTTVRRWGDYSAIGFDGWSSNDVWFATQYASNNGTNVNRWRTHIDELGYESQDQQ